jgi:uncharacterized protein YggT (Ycf19 family)
MAVELLIFIYFIIVPFLQMFKVNSEVIYFFNTITDPVLKPIRFLLKKSIFHSQRLDFSPIIAFLILEYAIIWIKNIAQ